ncbi:MAG: DUF4328 domain-containing protein [Planctomycetales bacterium]
MPETNPYESSSVSDSASSVPQTDNAYTYITAASRVRSLTVLFTVTGIWHLAMMGMNVTAVLTEVDNWGETQIDDMLYPTFWITYAALGLLILPIFIATVVVFCMWVHRSNANARALGSAGMKNTPGWCVGWFFIPLMNLFKPYQAVKEIYQSSDPECGQWDWNTARVSGILGLWWTLWIVTNLVDNIESRLGQTNDPEMLIISCWIGIVGSALGILLCLAATKVVRSIEDRLHRKAIKLGVTTKTP